MLNKNTVFKKIILKKFMNYEIFKAYDIRGVYPSEINKDSARLIGIAFAKLARSKTIIIGQDMRLSSKEIFEGLCDGITGAGKDVINIGLVSTDTVYYASGKMELPGIMITASHNPKKYNGMKFCLKKAKPVGKNTGLDKMQKTIKELEKLEQVKEKNISNKTKKQKIKGSCVKKKNVGKIYKKNILKDYNKFVLSFIDKKSIKPLKIIVDAGNGMAGKMVPDIFKKLPTKITPLYFKLDGDFPNHPANPAEKKNLKDLVKSIKQKKADVGMAFDGDADRVFFVDENGNSILASFIVAMVAKSMLLKNPKEKIIHDLRCGRIVGETIKEYGGKPIQERVGHSFIKATMKKTGAIFGGEMSGHYYYRDNFRADSGIITALLVLEILSKSNKKMSELVKEFEKYHQIDEVNFKVEDKDKKIKELKKIFKTGQRSELDGLSVDFKDWWFNVRPSNTEPVLRLNLEASTRKLMVEKKKELTKIIRNQ